ncbi:hypothetical protein [Yersinia aleksiciae]|uniref:hypothetical protein n=1 Tax=Yersinia aleksiciae TaxID=263819 RepID=UPI00119D2218|nr:hypothetical protein [Yersinia aleksiciae]
MEEYFGKDNGRMIGVKFLHQAVSTLAEQSKITVTDYLALRAFVLAERQNLAEYKERMLKSNDANYNQLPKDLRAYIELLDTVTSDLAHTGAGVENAVYAARISTGDRFFHWELDK